MSCPRWHSKETVEPASEPRAGTLHHTVHIPPLSVRPHCGPKFCCCQFQGGRQLTPIMQQGLRVKGRSPDPRTCHHLGPYRVHQLPLPGERHELHDRLPGDVRRMLRARRGISKKPGQLVAETALECLPVGLSLTHHRVPPPPPSPRESSSAKPVTSGSSRS